MRLLCSSWAYEISLCVELPHCSNKGWHLSFWSTILVFWKIPFRSILQSILKFLTVLLIRWLSDEISPFARRRKNSIWDRKQTRLLQSSQYLSLSLPPSVSLNFGCSGTCNIYTDQAGRELKRSVCLCLVSARIKGVNYHTPWLEKQNSVCWGPWIQLLTDFLHRRDQSASASTRSGLRS